jgi:hypothetical protein
VDPGFRRDDDIVTDGLQGLFSSCRRSRPKKQRRHPGESRDPRVPSRRPREATTLYRPFVNAM